SSVSPSRVDGSSSTTRTRSPEMSWSVISASHPCRGKITDGTRVESTLSFLHGPAQLYFQLVLCAPRAAGRKDGRSCALTSTLPICSDYSLVSDEIAPTVPVSLLRHNGRDRLLALA